MRQVIFQSENLTVVKVPGANDDTVFVTFESMRADWPTGRRGFGEDFFAKRGRPAYHFLPSGNHWYQYPEMPEALARVRADLPPGARVITYGMSMGGYAAYRFSEPLGAEVVIAFSPQYSIDRWRVWWERRWRSQSRAVTWDRQPPRAGAVKYVFYDPLNQDRRHIRALRREGALDLVRIYFSGHASITYVNECGLLESAVLDIAEGRFDAPGFERRIWQRRQVSETYARIRRRKRTGLFRRLRYILIEHLLERRLGTGGASDAAGLTPDRAL
ncbi:alpha/beta hydrolase [Ancylobacter sp. IITR112]|uniref:alpha/beta hydrolase n=1 Tax=Ancylobacter sp. IITR112 TaxID=3138073 RepID=UPI00352A9591